MDQRQLLEYPERLVAAVELHRPVWRDKHGYVTTEPSKALFSRCQQCGHSVQMGRGCNTWATATGQA